MLKSFLFDPDSGLLLFFNRIVHFFILSILTVLCSIPVVTMGAAISACLYCCRKMILHEDTHLIRKFFRAYKDNMKKGIILWVIMLDIFLILGGLLLILLYGERIFGISVQVPMVIDVVIFFVLFVCTMALMHVFPLNAYFENTVSNTLKNSFLVAFSDLPVTISLMVVNIAPVIFCVMNPFFWFFEVLIGVGFCAFCTAQLYRKIMKKLGVGEGVDIKEEDNSDKKKNNDDDKKKINSDDDKKEEINRDDEIKDKENSDVNEK